MQIVGYLIQWYTYDTALVTRAWHIDTCTHPHTIAYLQVGFKGFHIDPVRQKDTVAFPYQGREYTLTHGKCPRNSYFGGQRSSSIQHSFAPYSSLHLFSLLWKHRRRNRGGGGGRGGQGPPIIYARDFINIHTCSADCCIFTYASYVEAANYVDETNVLCKQLPLV